MDVTYEFEDIAPGGRIGLIALATDYNSETDIRRMIPEGVDMFTNRVLNANPITIENLRAMSGDITRAAEGILPELGVDVMIYGCTSGTAAIGAKEVQRLIQISQPGVPCTNPIDAATAALNALQVEKISILTPYIDSVNQAISDSFEGQEFNILNIEGLGIESDIDMTRVPLAALTEAALQVCDPKAEALFISCTAVRSSLIIDTLEQKLGKPVVTSNQALMWHSLRLIRNDSHVPGFGQLFNHVGD